MASTPSASALSAVLRCRGNIFTRNPPTKRPASSAYSLGLAGFCRAKRARSNQPSAWEAFLQGVSGGRSVTGAFKSPRMAGKVLREEETRKNNKLNRPKLSQSAGDVLSYVPGAQNSLVRQLVRRLSCNLPGIDKCSAIIQTIKYETRPTHICKIACVQDICEFPVGVLKVSIKCPCLMENAGHIPSFVLSGWSTLKSTCLSFTALVSGFMSLKLAVFWRSSSIPDDALGLHQNIKNNDLQTDNHSPSDITSSKDNSGSGQMVPEDRPD
ncbi:uncharacterized protein LOC117468580 [Trematomus bernacchii]|uniref:uncharacterized protein LOC117468580 n=1 Tax=Trematomus bernacchii TaxID=40690 RepID=UPI00146B662A|nr:uncharacterized protein LOC117468580 [Trematomus bernacchii]